MKILLKNNNVYNYYYALCRYYSKYTSTVLMHSYAERLIYFTSVPHNHHHFLGRLKKNKSISQLCAELFSVVLEYNNYGINEITLLSYI